MFVNNFPDQNRLAFFLYFLFCVGQLCSGADPTFHATGALGSTMLAYILPCLFHLKLCWSELPAPIKIKDIIIMGICCGVAGMYSVLHEIIG